MNSQYINVYMNNPTEDELDGVAVSADGDLTNPLEVTVDAQKEEVKEIKLAVRCNTGWGAPAGAKLYVDGKTKDRWGLSLTEDGPYTESIEITKPISVTNVVFWAQVKAIDEIPDRDMSVVIVIEADIVVD